MGIIIRGMANVLRNPVRLILVVVLLGASLMFVAAMVSLSTSANQELADIHKEVGTAITINYAENDAGNFGGTFGANFGGNTSSSTTTTTRNNGGATGGNRAFPGAGGNTTTRTTTTTGGNRGFNQVTSTPIPNTVVTQVAKVTGVASTEETIRQTDSDNVLKTSTITTPNGKTISIPATVYGISSGATHITLGSGSTPTMVDGSTFASSDNTAYVAMMNQSLAKTNNLKVGSTFTLKEKTFKLIGLYTTTDQFSSSTIIIPLGTIQSLYSVNGVDSITAYASNYEQVNTVTTNIKNALGTKYDVTSEASLYTSTFNALSVAQNSITLALYVSVIIAAVVIIFAVFMIVRERTVEIGTMKAIGASHWQVIRQFWGEVLAMSGLGAIVAVILLVVLGPTISQKFDIAAPTSGTTTGATAGGGRGGGFGGGRGFFSQAQQATSRIGSVHLGTATLNVETLLVIVGLGIALAVVTSIIPAWYVSRIKPAVVLRHS